MYPYDFKDAVRKKVINYNTYCIVKNKVPVITNNNNNNNYTLFIHNKPVYEHFEF